MPKQMLVLFLMTITTNLIGQIINVASKVDTNVKEGFKGEIEASSFRTSVLKKGNLDIELVDGNGAIKYRKGNHVLVYLFQRSYAKKDGKDFRDSSFQHLRYRHYFSKDVAMELFGQYNRNSFKSLSSRVVYGTGPRIDFPLGLSIGLALMQEKEIYTNDTYEINNRFSHYLAYQYEGDLASFYQTLYFQPKANRTYNVYALYDASDQRLLSDTTVKIKVHENLDFKVTGTITRDTSPPDPELEELDSSVKMSWVLSF